MIFMQPVFTLIINNVYLLPPGHPNQVVTSGYQGSTDIKVIALYEKFM